MTLGEKIEELRSDNGLSQKELAKMLKVAASTISHYETDTHSPDLENLVKIADMFNVSLDYLLSRTEESADLKWLEKEFGNLNEKILNIGDVVRKLEPLEVESRNLLLKLIDALEFKEKYSEK